jgi:hypothetical protein
VAPALFLLISTAVGVDVFIISFTKPLIGLFSPLAGLPLYAFIRARNKPDRG